MDMGARGINRRGLIIACAAVLAAILSGCSRGPESNAQAYVDDLKLYNYPACYDLLSQQDKIDRTLDQFLAEIPLAPVVNRDWFKAIVQATTFEVGSVKTLGPDKAVVEVKVTRPDLPLWERTIDAETGPNQDASSLAQKSLTEGTFPKLSYEDDIAMVKQPTGWKIFVDFPAREAIFKEHAEAVKAYHDHDYDKAIALYQQILQDLDKEQATGNEGLKFIYQRELNDIQNVKNQMADAKAYVSNLKLANVDRKMAASGVPAIFGTVTNGGDKPVDEVVCTVSYYEGKGKRRKMVYSEDHTIVATPLEFINFDRPVLPFIPGETRKFGFKLNAPVQIQQKAKPDLEVTGVAFTQSKAPLPKPQPTPAPEASPSPAAAASPSAAKPKP
jgi:hypothetical protein